MNPPKPFRGRFTVNAEVGEFGEARSSVQALFIHDADAATAARQELKAPPDCIGITSFVFTIRDDVDGTRLIFSVSIFLDSVLTMRVLDFELGELAGAFSNLLLLAKPIFKLDSHKSTSVWLPCLTWSAQWFPMATLPNAAQLDRQNESRVIVLSIFWHDIDELIQLRSGLIGADLKEIDGVIELSQNPSMRFPPSSTGPFFSS